MKAKEKAFTLIELLAVIVILAIVALVATPIVLNVINSSRDKANLSSAYGIADAARLYYNQSKFNGEEISENNLLSTLTIGGKKPEVGDVRVNSDGEITLALNYDNKCYYKGYKTGIITVSEYAENTCLADGSQAPDICFEFESETGTITGYNADLRECGPYVIIPNQIGGVDVEVIGEEAFDTEGIYGVVIPNSVTSIEYSAFYYNNLTSVTIPNSVTSIGSHAFSDNNLTDLVIPSSVTSIGEGAFADNNLTSVTIPNSVTNIGDGAFSGNNLPHEQALIYARNNDGSEDLTHIASYGGKIIHFDIPEGVLTIGYAAFSFSELTSVTIPNSVTTIGEYAFFHSNLTSVIIPNSVTTIGEYAFYSNSLTSVTILNSVTSIGAHAFEWNSLTSVTIPSSVTTIGDDAFFNNWQLSAIKADPTKGYNYTSIIGDRYTNGYIDVLNINTANTTTNCFEFNSSNGTITRYKHWYDNCTSEVVIPTQIDGVSVITIDYEAFDSSGIAGVTIPEGVTTIRHYAFSNNNLTNVAIPSSVTNIGEGAFNNNLLNENDAYIYARTSSEIDYSTIVSYGGASKNITIPSSFNDIALTSIGDYAFSDNNLTSVTIPSSVTSIGEGAFYGNLLTNVTIPNSVTTIGEEAFGENNLTSVTIPSSMTSIGDSAFYENNLTSVTIPSSVTSIESYAFLNNNITSVTIPNSVTTIGGGAFFNNNLSEIILPSSLTSLGENAFGDNGITTLTIPSGVTELESNAFEEYMWLTDIYINKPEDSVTGAPWNAPKAAVHWARLIEKNDK